MVFPKDGPHRSFVVRGPGAGTHVAVETEEDVVVVELFVVVEDVVIVAELVTLVVDVVDPEQSGIVPAPQ